MEDKGFVKPSRQVQKENWQNIESPWVSMELYSCHYGGDIFVKQQ